MRKLNVWIIDIETSPLLAFVWGRHDQNIGLNQIKEEWNIMAWAAKRLGDKACKTQYKDQRDSLFQNDKDILGGLWKILDEADVIITQNGQNFDAPKLNARFIMNGMNPPSPYKHLDTYQIVRKVAKFTSNSLEYLTGKLCTRYKKLSHKKFPGMLLWTECLKGNKKAWDEMKRYNIHDVLATEEFYNKIRAWAPDSMPNTFFVEDPAKECGRCGSTGKMQRRGERVNNKTRYTRYQCQGCGKWQTGEKIG